MTTSTLTGARPRSRLWLKLVACAVVLLGTSLAFVWYLAWSEEREYQALLAETDRLDPGWRLDEILAALPALPEDRTASDLDSLRQQSISARQPGPRRTRTHPRRPHRSRIGGRGSDWGNEGLRQKR